MVKMHKDLHAAVVPAHIHSTNEHALYNVHIPVKSQQCYRRAITAKTGHSLIEVALHIHTTIDVVHKTMIVVAHLTLGNGKITYLWPQIIVIPTLRIRQAWVACGLLCVKKLFTNAPSNESARMTLRSRCCSIVSTCRASKLTPPRQTPASRKSPGTCWRIAYIALMKSVPFTRKDITHRSQ